nr:unnamed protein product [Spirometra erinaceieuropaei]
MFTSGLAETRADNVQLEGLNGQALSSVVHFIYTNELPDCTDLLLGLLPVADFLRLGRLVNLLCALLARRLDVKNCLQIMRAAKTCNCNDLWHNSKLFAQRTFPEVVDRNTVFSQLSLVDLEDLIRSDSTLGGEETIFQAILKWSEEKEDPNSRLNVHLKGMWASEVDATVETNWDRLRNVIHFPVLDIFGRARRQHQSWSGGDWAEASNFLLEKRLYTTHVNHKTAVNKTTFFFVGTGFSSD